MIIKNVDRLEKRETLYAHFQKRDMSIETNCFDRYIVIPNKFIDFFSVDLDGYNKISNNAKEYEQNYYLKQMEKEFKTRAERKKTLDWLLFYFERLKVKQNGGYGLSGKQGVM